MNPGAPDTTFISYEASNNLAFYKVINGPGEENRTPVSSLEGWRSTIELHRDKMVFGREPITLRVSFSLVLITLLGRTTHGALDRTRTGTVLLPRDFLTTLCHHSLNKRFIPYMDSHQGLFALTLFQANRRSVLQVC